MTKAERNRRSRRITLAALAVSGALHVAALLWLALPVPVLPSASKPLAVLPPLMQAVMLDVEVPTPPVTAAAQAAAADAGSAGVPAEAAPPRPAPQAPAPDAAILPRPMAGEEITLAALDSLASTELMAQPVAETAPVIVAALPAGEAPGAGAAAAPAPPVRKHIPGSAAKAKGGGGASVGASPSGGFGGITIRMGGGGKKKHPPRFPGRGRW